MRGCEWDTAGRVGVGLVPITRRGFIWSLILIRLLFTWWPFFQKISYKIVIKINFRTTWLPITPNYKQNILSGCSGSSVFPWLLRPPIEKLMIFSWSGFSSTHLSIHPSNPYYGQTHFLVSPNFRGVSDISSKNFRIQGNIRTLENIFLIRVRFVGLES